MVRCAMRRLPASSLNAGKYRKQPVSNRNRKLMACVQCSPRSVAVNRRMVGAAAMQRYLPAGVGNTPLLSPKIGVDGVAVLLPVADLLAVAELDAVDPLGVLVAVHLGHHEA